MKGNGKGRIAEVGGERREGEGEGAGRRVGRGEGSGEGYVAFKVRVERGEGADGVVGGQGREQAWRGSYQ